MSKSQIGHAITHFECGSSLFHKRVRAVIGVVEFLVSFFRDECQFVGVV